MNRKTPSCRLWVRDPLTHTQPTGDAHALPGRKPELRDADTLTLTSRYGSRSLCLRLSMYMTLSVLQRESTCCVCPRRQSHFAKALPITHRIYMTGVALRPTRAAPHVRAAAEPQATPLTC